jgi:hypothetical protein
MGLGPFAHPQILDGADRRRSPDQVGVRNCGKSRWWTGEKRRSSWTNMFGYIHSGRPTACILRIGVKNLSFQIQPRAKLYCGPSTIVAKRRLRHPKRRPGLVYEWSPDSKEILVTQTGIRHTGMRCGHFPSLLLRMQNQGSEAYLQFRVRYLPATHLSRRPMDGRCSRNERTQCGRMHTLRNARWRWTVDSHHG